MVGVRSAFAFYSSGANIRRDSPDDYDDGAYIDDHYWPDCTSSYISLEQLEEDMNWARPQCMEEYILQVELVLFDNALEKYKELIDHGYDGKFETYQRYVKEQIPGQINNFMASDKVDKYFTCRNYKHMNCCDKCKYGCGVPGKDCLKGSNCVAGHQFLDMDACPRYEFDPPVISGDYIPNATFTPLNENEFFKDLSDTWGIDKDWVKFGNRLLRANNACMGAGLNVQEFLLKNNNYLRNYPVVSDDMKVYNPKDIVGSSYSNATDIRNSIEIMAQAGNYDEQMDMRDLVDASSLPPFSLQEAVESMEKIVEQAKEIEQKEREEMILDFITGLLFWIPFVGEGVGAAGMTATRSMLRLIGGVGDAAMTIYDIVQSPENAFMAVFSSLAGAGVGRAGFKSAAKSRRSISKKDYDSLGTVKVKLDKIESLRAKSCPV